MNSLEKLKNLKEEAKNELLADETLSNVEKLNLFTEHDLGYIDSFVQDIFSDWKKECEDMEREAAIKNGKDPEKDYICNMTDQQIFNVEHRGNVVYYNEVVENLMYDYEENLDEEIEVVTCRGDYESVLTKPVREVIDRICQYAFENNQIGFEYDW